MNKFIFLTTLCSYIIFILFIKVHSKKSFFGIPFTIMENLYHIKYHNAIHHRNKPFLNSLFLFYVSDESEGAGFTAFLITAISIFLIIITVPFSLCLCVKVRSFSNNRFNFNGFSYLNPIYDAFICFYIINVW